MFNDTLHGHCVHTGVPIMSHSVSDFLARQILGKIPDMTETLGHPLFSRIPGTRMQKSSESGTPSPSVSVPPHGGFCVYCVLMMVPKFPLLMRGHPRLSLSPYTKGQKSSWSSTPSLSVSLSPLILITTLDCPAFHVVLSVTVRTTVYIPALLYICVVFPFAFPVDPSQKSHRYIGFGQILVTVGVNAIWLSSIPTRGLALRSTEGVDCFSVSVITKSVAEGLLTVFWFFGSMISRVTIHPHSPNLEPGRTRVFPVKVWVFAIFFASQRYSHVPVAVRGIKSKYSPWVNVVFHRDARFLSTIAMAHSMVFVVFLVWHCVYSSILAAMRANSPRVIFSSCPMLPSFFCSKIFDSIHFFAYPYQYDDTSLILIDVSVFCALSVSFQRFARLRSIAVASIRDIVFVAQNGELV